MRTDKELIQLMIDNLDQYFITSLCITTSQMRIDNLINQKEEDRIDEIVYRFKPSDAGPFYFWPANLLEPRREFLQNILNKL